MTPFWFMIQVLNVIITIFLLLFSSKCVLFSNHFGYGDAWRWDCSHDDLWLLTFSNSLCLENLRGPSFQGGVSLSIQSKTTWLICFFFTRNSCFERSPAVILKNKVDCEANKYGLCIVVLTWSCYTILPVLMFLCLCVCVRPHLSNYLNWEK